MHLQPVRPLTLPIAESSFLHQNTISAFINVLVFVVTSQVLASYCRADRAYLYYQRLL